ncbi:MAG: phosphoribosylformylglycinamidine synthase, partial [Bacteroidales bacterium]|jgi:phosphoribosylformylglycinamidine synthase|nr:phosphoribosylformylglycinamidine synthase [Bacteroidales bacterium]
MILFFESNTKSIIAVGTSQKLSVENTGKLAWLFNMATLLEKAELKGTFVGPRKEMITPWSTNAVEITQNMGLTGITRIEEFFPAPPGEPVYDRMLQMVYHGLGQDLYTIDREPEPIVEIEDIAAYNLKEGLALSNEEIGYLEKLSASLGRRLTDSEVFGFSQVNSEHCRHKIFNGTFVVDGETRESTLFQLIKATTRTNPNRVVSAYRDNCAFLQGPVAEIFAPATQDTADYFRISEAETVISLKAETHNFPTTVEPFNGASTGTGGEIRDRIAGGKGAFPVAGTAVYMTSYPRNGEGRDWEKITEPRKWLYQTPEDILIKASNGASDFGNKFGQPLICGSVLTYETFTSLKKYGYDKVIMLAGGIGFGRRQDSEKAVPSKGDLVVLLGGDNYRIGMGGGAVSSVDTGEFHSSIELNAVQRANPEMQKRVYNALRALAESDRNPVISLHDHGAGGHLNCLSELVEATGGKIDISKLPVGDPTLSAREIIGNESQERMGLVIARTDFDTLKRIAERERAPIYAIGEITGNNRFTFENPETGEKPIDLDLASFFGDPPRTVMNDSTLPHGFAPLRWDPEKIYEYTAQVLQMEEVACKDWLTNKVDRSVTGRIAGQQCVGELQYPLGNMGVIALDYTGRSGVATSIGHAPATGLVDPAAGSQLSIAEALTNIVWAPLTHGLRGVSLSANWMWPCKNQGEDARLYAAVEAASAFAIALGINIPTGKDSLSMTQKYGNETVYAPGTVIISAAAEVSDVRRLVEPVIVNDPGKSLIYIDMSCDDLCPGGSSFSQLAGTPGDRVPRIADPRQFGTIFSAIQELIAGDLVVAGHDISAGGMITTLLEMCFSNKGGGLAVNLESVGVADPVRLLLSQNPGVIIQVADEAAVEEFLLERGITYHVIGHPVAERKIFLRNGGCDFIFDIDEYRGMWLRTSYLADRRQCGEQQASERLSFSGATPLKFNTGSFRGSYHDAGVDPGRRTASGIRAAIIREKGVNGDREMAYALWLAGFDVKDVHMTDLVTGREKLEDISMIVFVGGFSNSDVPGSAKGWAGAFRYNEKARIALEKFYSRSDTLSLGVCNGCQLMAELELIYPGHKQKPLLLHNKSHKFESAFLGVKVLESPSVMLKGLEGMELGIWVAHGEGQFSFPYGESEYHIPVKYSYDNYPANPNGSAFNAAAICSADGRHLAIMPHLERAFLPWQCAYYPIERRREDVTPWMKAFVNAFTWARENSGS